MYITTVTLKFAQHNAYIRVDENRRIHCFKYNAKTCDFYVFDDQFEASEWILEPLPTIYYCVTIRE